MWQLLIPLRKRVEADRIPARRPRRYRPRCRPLEDRRLLAVTLTAGGPPIPLVGAPVLWTARASGHGATPVYQFSVGPVGGPSHVVRDFSTSNTLTWDPLQEGNFDVRVTVKDGFGATAGESASAAYTARSRVVGADAVVSPTANPLVALYSAPPSAAGSMYVEFSPAGPNPSWRTTSAQPVVPGESTNFLVAGLLPDTTYLMRHVLDSGAASAPLEFTTGAPPTSLTFPTFTVPQAPAPGTDLTQDMIYHIGIASTPSTVNLLATDLAGNIEWYYDPAANNFPTNYAPTLEPGGTAFLLGQPTARGGAAVLREIDLAGDPLRETNVDAVSAELAARGLPSINNFNHDALILPNGDVAVLANTPRTINVNGTPTLYNGDMVVVLDRDFQVAWAWDPFAWLDTNRLPTLGEGPGDWTHANSIAWSPTDGDLLVSMRAQDWVIKIAYDDGAGDGHVVWRLGQGGDFTINSSDPSPWFSHQHDVRYINNTTLTLFDDGNTRRSTDPTAQSRGQELVLNEQTKQATLAVNADLGTYSSALGSAQSLPNGNLAFTSGFLGSSPDLFGQSVEVRPDGTRAYVQQMNGLLEYRSYFMRTLYGPLVAPRGRDATTQGTWIGTYGSEGYDVVGAPSSLPAGVTVTPSGQSSYTWAAGTADPRALQVPGQAGRVAATWFSRTSFTVDVSLDDGRRHNLELYFLDWDSNARAEQVTVTDVATGLVLNSQSISSFHSGLYLDYAVSGRVRITITRQGGANAVLSGLFLDTPPQAIATPIKSDATTQGTWIGTYGAQGYDVIGAPSSLPAGVTVTPSGQSSYTWAAGTTDPRALQKPGGTGRVAATWFSAHSFTVDVNLGDGKVHDLALYFLDWDSNARAEQVTVTDAATGVVLDSRSISSFHAGLYLDYAVSGHIRITITRQAGANAVLSGLFLDPPATATAKALKRDTSTQGTWIGTYGSDGYDVIGDSASLPADATIVPTGQSSFTWAAGTTDPRALQKAGGTGRVAATWFSPASFTVDVNLGDGKVHGLALYFLDWDSNARAEQVTITDAATGVALSTQSVSSFHSGVYLDYAVSGHIRITITRQAGANAVLSGLFLD